MALLAFICRRPAAALMVTGLLAACGGAADEPSGDVRYSRNRVELYGSLEHDAPVLTVLGFDTEVAVLDTHRSFVRVRTPDRLEGWVPGTLLLDGPLRSQHRSLTRASATLQSQGGARARDTLNVHTEPYRWAPTLYQLAKDERFDILDRMLVDRLPAAAADRSRRYAPTGEDYWYLVRIPHAGAVGWLLANMVYPDIPIDVAALAEGRSIVAHFRTDVAEDGSAGETVPVWTWFQSSEPGQVHDFDILRVLRWHTRRKRYIVLRQVSGLAGYLPVEVLPGFESSRGTGTGIRVFAQADGELRRRTYVQVGTRSVYLGQEPVIALPHLTPPGGFGRRYERTPQSGF